MSSLINLHCASFHLALCDLGWDQQILLFTTDQRPQLSLFSNLQGWLISVLTGCSPISPSACAASHSPSHSLLDSSKVHGTVDPPHQLLISPHPSDLCHMSPEPALPHCLSWHLNEPFQRQCGVVLKMLS